MSVELVVAASSRATGALLNAALREVGVEVTPTARCRVSYGVSGLGTEKPTLNRSAGEGNKYDQMVRVREAGVLVPTLYLATDTPDKFPLLGRKFQHRAGTDIKVVLQAEEIPWRSASGSDFFVEHVPIAEEFRVWVFRGRHLGTYRKEQRHPEQFKRVGRNFKNGFAFVSVERDNVPPVAVDMARVSIKALNLDFGAVDIIHGNDGRMYFLEVNTAPGVQGPRHVIGALARRIAKWSENPD